MRGRGNNAPPAHKMGNPARQDRQPDRGNVDCGDCRLSIRPETLEKLMTIEMSAEARMAVMRVFLEDRAHVEKLRTGGAERTARWRAKRTPNVTNVTSDASRNVTSDVSPNVTVTSPNVTSDASTRAEPILSEVGDNKKKESKKGTRLPVGWLPSDGSWTSAVEKLGIDKAKLELEKFRDHFAAKAGQAGVGLDWDATWRNWARKAFEWLPQARAGPNGHRAKPSSLSVFQSIANGTDKSEPRDNSRPSDGPDRVGPTIEGDAVEIFERGRFG